MATMSPLCRRMIEDMTVRNLSRSTQQSYLYAVAKFSRHFNRAPDRLGMEEGPRLPAQKLSWSHINQVTCALRFFYGITLGHKEALERIVTGKEPEKLPPVLSPEEIVLFLEAVAGLRNRIALTTAYAAGLRIGEAALKVSSIDSKRMLLHIEHGKGGRDRYAMLSPRLLDILRVYWKRARPSLWLFPGQEPGRHVSTGALQAACRAARKRARIGKHVTAHSLRLLSTTVSAINPSHCCLPLASVLALKRIALLRIYPPPQPNPHSRVRGAFRAPSPAGSFLGGFRTPAQLLVAPSTMAGVRNPAHKETFILVLCASTPAFGSANSGD